MTFDDKVLALCLIYDCSETSGYRTERRNKAEKGADDSRHKEALARDIVPDDRERDHEIFHAARKLGLWVLIEPDHIHLQEPRN